MPYLTKEEQAMLTLGGAARVENATAVVTQIGQAASGIVASLLTAAAGVTLDTLDAQIKGYLGRNITLAQALKGASPANLVNMIESQLEQDYKNIVTLTKAGIGQGVGGIHAGLYELLNGTNALTTSYLGLIERVGVDPFIARWVNSTVKPNIPDPSTAWMMRKLGLLTDADYKSYAAQAGWDAGLLSKIESVFESPVPISFMMDMARRGYVPWEDVKVQMRRFGWKETIIDKAIYLTDQIPEPYRLADFTAKGILAEDQNRAAFKWFGMNEGWADAWAESQQQYPSIGILNEMMWRGLISQSTWSLLLKRQGWRDDVIEAAFSLTQLIPPAQDLVTMVVREAWEPANVTPAPDVFAKYMAMKGFSKDWANRYWTAHWLPMPINLAYANLYRGYWTKEQFDDLLRIADLHPRWREAIYDVAFQPPSIREMGYGFDVGAYSREDIIRYRRWGGLSPEDATKAADSLVAYRTEAEREAVRRNYLYLYTLGHLTYEQFGESLDDLGTNPASKLLWLERGELEKLRKELEAPVDEPKAMTRATAQWLFESELRTEEWFRGQLTFLGYSSDAVDAYIDQSKERIRLEQVKREAVTPRKLTLSQDKDLYASGYIDEKQLFQNVIDLGYSVPDATIITQKLIDDVYAAPSLKEFSLSQMVNFFELDLVDDRAIHKYLENQGYTYQDATLLTQYIMITAALPDLKAQYSKGWISSGSMYNALIDLDVPVERAQKIMKSVISATQGDRLADARALTKAEIIKGAKNNVISASDAVSLLMDIGYEEWEAYYLLAINSIVSAGDPEGYWEMKRTTELYKRARGEPFLDVPQEVINLERLAKQARVALNEAKKKTGNEDEIGRLTVELNDAEVRLKTTVAKLKLK